MRRSPSYERTFVEAWESTWTSLPSAESYCVAVSQGNRCVILPKLSFSAQRSSRQQVSRIALERNEDKRMQFQALIGDLYPAETLVFLDESHCDRRTAQRQWGWAPVGDRARRRDFFIRGTKCVIPAPFRPHILSKSPFQILYPPGNLP